MCVKGDDALLVREANDVRIALASAVARRFAQVGHLHVIGRPPWALAVLGDNREAKRIKRQNRACVCVCGKTTITSTRSPITRWCSAIGKPPSAQSTTSLPVFGPLNHHTRQGLECPTRSIRKT